MEDFLKQQAEWLNTWQEQQHSLDLSELAVYRQQLHKSRPESLAAAGLRFLR